uniref:Syndecan domain-containing protein n=1 Tax=Macrostomum lignano TaxID=282301 RepID=A0A1I8J4U8_9PLAT
IVAEALVISVGHPKELATDYRGLKQALDARLLGGRFAGMRLLPAHYRFWRLGMTLSDPAAAVAVAGTAAPAFAATYSSAETVSSGLPLNSNSSGQLLASPGLLAAAVAGVAGAAVLLLILALFCVHRIRKADEGSYALGPAASAGKSWGGGAASAAVMHNGYRRAPTREYYA